MKPIYFLLFSLLTLLACTDQQTELEGASHAMRFGVEGVEDTKGAVINTLNIRSMSVFCAHTGTGMYNSSSTCDWMHNVQVTRADENSEWTVEGEGVNKQWAGEGYHSFFAFAPHLPNELFSASTDPGPPTLTYTVPTDHTKQVDLLYSLTTPINCKQMYIGSRPVVFGFRHALAKITFDARKEDIVTDEVTITNIRLSSIINKARYTFTMTEGYTDVKGISRTTESTDISDFSITPNQVLTNESTILLPDDQALFMINQSFTANNKLIVTYNKGPETGKTITADLLTVTPQGWDFSKAYRYSILVREDKVTITAEVQPWNDQPVDVVVPGTYLNITPLSLSLTQGTAGDIYYSTDGSPVTATCNNGITLTHDPIAKKFTFPATAAAGNYIVTVSAGILKREVPTVIEDLFIVEDGVAAPRIFVQGTGNDAKLMLTKKPANYGAYFQFMGITAWAHNGANNSGAAIYKPMTTNTVIGAQGWTSTNDHSLISINAGKGDPCRLVGYTQKQVQDMVNAGTVPDNGKWKTPEKSTFVIDGGVAFANRDIWAEAGVEKIKGQYMSKTNTTDNFLPAAGLSWKEGSWVSQGSQGCYWTQTVNGDQGETVSVQEKYITKDYKQHHSLRMSIRCVRQ